MPHTPPPSAPRPAWRSAASLAALVALECGVAGWWLGPGFVAWLAAVPGKRPAGLALLGGLMAVWAHVDGQRRDYAMVGLSWPLVVGQIAASAAATAMLAWLSADPASATAPGMLPLVVAVMLVPTMMALVAVAPSPAHACRLVVTTLFWVVCPVAAWVAGDLTAPFWAVSGDTTMWLVERLLGPLAGSPVVRPEPFVIGTDAFQVRIGPACSGFHGMGLMTVLLVGSLWWFRAVYRFPQALLLVPLGGVLMWLVNVLRIVALILVGIWISPAIAVDGFHSVAGWIGFLTVGLGTIWAASRSPFFSVPETPTPPGGEPVAPAGLATGAGTCAAVDAVPATSCLLPFLVLTAVTMLTRAFTSGFDLLYPLRVLAVACVLWRLRDTLPWRECRPAVVPVAIGVVTFACWMLLAPAGAQGSDTAAQDPFQLPQPWAAVWLLVRVVGATVTVPIAEELFFRGFVSRRCIAADVDAVPIGAFSWFSCVTSSLVFGLLHGEAWLAGIVAGFLFYAAVRWRGRLGDAVVAHATTNALLAGYVIATGSWADWG